MSRQNPQIEPLHGIRDKKKLDTLIKSMKKHGWVGEPIPCLWDGQEYKALTGSHRIAAAEIAGIKVPIYMVDVSDHTINYSGECEVCGEECWVQKLYDAKDDDERLEASLKSGDDELIRLLDAEIDKNL